MKKLLAVAATLSLLATAAHAADWPTKPVRVVVPFAPGGSADVISRLIMDSLSKAFGQQFYIENRPGGGGIVAAQFVAKSAPDGYTLMQSGMSSFVLAPAMSNNPGFDPVKDFDEIAFIGGAPSVILVHPSLNVHSFKELIDYTRKAPGGLEYGSAGVGTVGNIVAESIARKEKITFTHVPYKSGGGAMLDLLSGRLKMGAMNWSTAREHLRSGKLIALAVSSSNREPDSPDIPTLTEAGYPDLATTTWQALAGPRGMPKDIIEKINREVIKSLEHPELRKQFEQDGAETKAMTPAEMSAFMATEVAKWAPLVKSSVAAKE
jgi:tripartite-type tricarboxylate transporter receptor subunit TctC